MATLTELIPYLKRGYTLQSVRGETIRPLTGSMVEWNKTKGFRFEPEKYSLADMEHMHDVWSWGVVFADTARNPYCLTDLPGIEDAIARGTPGASYGEQE